MKTRARSIPFSSPSLSLVLATTLLCLAGTTSTVEATPAAYLQLHDQLQRSELGFGKTRDLGDLHYDFLDFDFDAQGRLWGITDRSLYRLDAQSALPQEVGSLGVSGEIHRADMAISEDGELWFFRVLQEPLVTVLYRASLEDAQASEVARFDQLFDGLAFRGGLLTALISPQLFFVDSEASTLIPFGKTISGGGPPTTFTHLASLGERLFAKAFQVIAPPDPTIVELFPDTGEMEIVGNTFGIGLALRDETCTPSETALCFGNGRFEVTVEWRDFAGMIGQGQRLPWTSEDSGLFQFFGANNWEMLVKVLSGCALNDRVWVLASAATNVGFTLTVRDTTTGEERSYENPLGNPAVAVLDSDAFQACP